MPTFVKPVSTPVHHFSLGWHRRRGIFCLVPQKAKEDRSAIFSTSKLKWTLEIAWFSRTVFS